MAETAEVSKDDSMDYQKHRITSKRNSSIRESIRDIHMKISDSLQQSFEQRRDLTNSPGREAERLDGVNNSYGSS